MITFLKNLEQKAARFVGVMDSQLQEPIVQVISGDVFTHEPVSQLHDCEDLPSQPAQQPIHAAIQPKRKIGMVDFDSVQADFAECQITEADPMTFPATIRVSGIL